MAEELLRTEITDERGLHTVRRAGRHVAAAVLLDHPDQVRVATALSEVGRALYAYAGKVAVRFLLERGAQPALTIEFGFAPRPGVPRPVDGDEAAARLVDLVQEEAMEDRPEGERVVRLRKNLPPRGSQLTDSALEATRAGLEHLRPVPALEELRTQNAELIEALEVARRQHEELKALNAELEETNQGVMALYNELSGELENTNRGVLALHSELDDKSRQLREASEAKNRFWANISHELRTPLNGVIGLARLLLDPAADPLTEEQRHQITLICATAEGLLSQVNELLDIAKAEQGRLEAHPVPVDVAELLEDVRQLLAPMAEEAGLELTVDASGAPPVLVTDQVMLERILRNLVSNGLKFTRAGGVRITAETVSDHVRFVVSDTGVGIAPEHLEHLFDEFYTVPGSGTTGTGLGLPYSQRLALLLGGDLTLDSVPGEGTTVTVRIPLTTPQEADSGDGERE